VLGTSRESASILHRHLLESLRVKLYCKLRCYNTTERGGDQCPVCSVVIGWASIQVIPMDTCWQRTRSPRHRHQRRSPCYRPRYPFAPLLNTHPTEKEREAGLDLRQQPAWAFCSHIGKARFGLGCVISLRFPQSRFRREEPRDRPSPHTAIRAIAAEQRPTPAHCTRETRSLSTT
jgi:hypothetical protein